MRWKSVAVAGAIWPATAGCNIAHEAARNIINEPHVVWTQHALEHDLKKSARAAWETSKGQCPERANSSEFRDGFVDGYVDYLDRGGIASLPAVPPAKYTRHKKYFTENGQCLVKEYFLGFKFGQEVAIATGRRQLLTVPVLLPQLPQGPPAFNVQPAAATPAPPTMPIPRPLPVPEPLASVAREVPVVAVPAIPVPPPQVPPPPKPRVVPKTPPTADFDPAEKPVPVAVPLSKGPPPAAFDPTPMPTPKPEPIAEPVRLPVATPPLPLPVQPAPSGPSAWGNLPAIPSVPTPQLPPPTIEVSTPRVLPPNHTVRPPLPPNHPQPR